MLQYLLFPAPDDYEGIAVSLTFTADEVGSREECTNVSIVNDQLVEEIESFAVFINSSDTSVSIGRDNSSIILLDSSGKESET